MRVKKYELVSFLIDPGFFLQFVSMKAVAFVR